MIHVRASWMVAFLLSVLMTCALAAVGVMNGPLGSLGFLTAGPDEEAWIVETMPETFAQRGQEIGVVRWTPDGALGDSSAWSDERTFTLGPMSAGGGFLDPEEVVSCWRLRVGWPLRSFEMSDWSRGTVRVEVDRFPAFFGAGFGGVPIGIRPAQLLGNLAFLTVAFGIVLTVLGEWRQRWRRRAGACIECGHLLAGATRCPECGATSES